MWNKRWSSFEVRGKRRKPERVSKTICWDMKGNEMKIGKTKEEGNEIELIINFEEEKG
jgi:hypothetical protein